MADDPLLPDYDGACITNVVPALLHLDGQAPAWLPASALDADRVVLLVIDGLGWTQLQQRRHLAPTLAALVGGPITTVAPSTTATALTSISTGLPPGEHGVMGYRMAVDGEVLNVLRWTTPQGDARRRIVPRRGPAARGVRRAAAAGGHPSRVRRVRLHAAPTSTRRGSPATARSAP